MRHHLKKNNKLTWNSIMQIIQGCYTERKKNDCGLFHIVQYFDY